MCLFRSFIAVPSSVHDKFRDVLAALHHGPDHLVDVDGAVDDVAVAPADGLLQRVLQLINGGDVPPLQALSLIHIWS